MKYSLEQCQRFVNRYGYDKRVDRYQINWTNNKPVSMVSIEFFQKEDSDRFEYLYVSFCEFPIDVFLKFVNRGKKIRKILK